MRDQSLRGHIANLEQQGELIRITKEADPHENVAAIGWKAYDRPGKATLFDNLKGFPGWQLVNQVITDRRKWAIALGVSEDELIATLDDRIFVLTPQARVLELPQGATPIDFASLRQEGKVAPGASWPSRMAVTIICRMRVCSGRPLSSGMLKRNSRMGPDHSESAAVAQRNRMLWRCLGFGGGPNVVFSIRQRPAAQCAIPGDPT